MGCGSSTKVQEIKPPKESHSQHRGTPQDRPNGSAKHDRKSISAKSRSSRSSSKKSHGKRSSSSSSSSSDDSVKSRDKKHKKKAPEAERKPSGGSQRIRSGGSRRIRSGDSQRHVSSGRQRQELVVPEEHTEDNVTVIKFNNNEIKELEVKNDDDDTNNVIVQNKNKIIKGKVHDDTSFPYNILEALMVVTGLNKQEEHEKKAKMKEERRAKMDKDKDEELVLTDMSLVPLDISKTEEESPGNNYTIDDIVSHNTEVGKRDWFKYGQKMYSVEKLIPVVKERMTLFIECTIANYRDGSGFLYMIPELSSVEMAIDRNNPKQIEASTTKAIQNITSFRDGYPVYAARKFGVTRKDLKNVLSVCLIGNIVEIEESVKIERLKQSVENTIEAIDEDEGESGQDFKNQLNRWLQDYPNVQINNEPLKADVDFNEQTFPLPQAILFDPLILRNWIQDWVLFDTEIAEEGAWRMTDPQNEDIGDCHVVFSNIVKERVDESIPELDMTIDGEAAWYVIEIDIFKTDKTTEGQDEIWKLREKRTNLNDPKWMERRRAHIGDLFVARHELDPNIIAPFLSFAENLELSWKAFLELCEKDSSPPKGTLAGSPKGKDIQVKRSGSVMSSKSSGSSSHNGNNSVQDIKSVHSLNVHAETSQLILNGDNRMEKEETDGEEENNTFMTSTEEEIEQSKDTAENIETGNNMLILNDEKSNADNSLLDLENGKDIETEHAENNVLNLENETENTENNVLNLNNDTMQNLENDTEETAKNVLKLENDTRTGENNINITGNTDNNVLNLENGESNTVDNVLNLENDHLDLDNSALDLERNKSEPDNNILNLDTEHSSPSGNNVNVLSRERSGTSCTSSKSSRKSPGVDTMDSGLDLDH